ncbi:hypothetical protein C4K38_2155 [Pseudomonas chlororaphis subsp. piscium]|uniref:hypothetical protein n=1 Tax=Pseudomonas chlororaphis TaxID=587753 RepID=UPI0006A5F2BD|nr:hypothetical protein [Pseudomonas chlororaphis]AZC30115.1 hypothetical protein C4K38_2155 [Pseudomonas chlororaphis subsp. piscium]WDG94048.1 hypothetical protein PUP49_11680 [Pseudomonas chlororaphis]SDT24580.1 hypothetical protein SAMN05216585_5221 [Pseudomonas chlororaphis]
MKFKVKAYFNESKHRALAIPEDKTLEDLSAETRAWIGPTVTQQFRELDTSEKLIGFDPQTVWDDFQAKGFSTYEITATVTVING